MFLFYVLSFFKKRTLFKGGQYLRKLYFFEFNQIGNSTYRCGNYSRAEAIRGNMVYDKILHTFNY